MMLYPDAVLMVFCKAPVPGQVKTRLMPPLSAEEAVQLHCELTLKTLQTATRKHLCDVQLWCSPGVDHPFFERMAKQYSLVLRSQTGNDLGEKMHQAFRQALSRYNSAVLIGCDCPVLTSEHLERAIGCLQQDTQCVVTPAEDGGYVLIGLTIPRPALFENMPWGSDKVLEITRNRLQSLRVPYRELDTLWDVDTSIDLMRYRRQPVNDTGVNSFQKNRLS